jgi:hypothetical protein
MSIDPYRTVSDYECDAILAAGFIGDHLAHGRDTAHERRNLDQALTALRAIDPLEADEMAAVAQSVIELHAQHDPSLWDDDPDLICYLCDPLDPSDEHELAADTTELVDVDLDEIPVLH